MTLARQGRHKAGRYPAVNREPRPPRALSGRVPAAELIAVEAAWDARPEASAAALSLLTGLSLRRVQRALAVLEAHREGR